MADIARLQAVAQRVKQEIENGHQVAVVVSAMAGVTNQLISYIRSLTPLSYTPEHDVVLSSGEQVSCGLLALTLNQMGVPARSFMGWQIPIYTDPIHTNAQIRTVFPEILETCLQTNTVPVVAGFQGLSADQRVTTLGRGGSDTTAVALAAALQADRCDIYTDVDGVYTADPRIVNRARRLNSISYEEMLELSLQGAKVLQMRSVEMGMHKRIKLRVLSSFIEGQGTVVTFEPLSGLLRPVSSIAYSLDEARISLKAVPDEPQIIATIFSILAEIQVNIDMIVKNIAHGDQGDLTITVPKEHLSKAVIALEENHQEIEFSTLKIDPQVVKISAVGAGMRHHPRVASTMFQALAAENTDVQVISTSEIKISVLVPEKCMESSLCALHAAFNLHEDNS